MEDVMGMVLPHLERLQRFGRVAFHPPTSTVSQV